MIFFSRFKSESESLKSDEKLLGDFGYDWKGFHHKNDFARDCLLKKLKEKDENFEDEAYYVKKLEDIRMKTNNIYLVVTLDGE